MAQLKRNWVVRELAAFASLDVGDKHETLMTGGTITHHVSDQLPYDTMLQTEEGLGSVLVMTGYLSKAGPSQVGDTVALRIPNREVAGILQIEIMELFAQNLDTDLQDALMEALWSGMCYGVVFFQKDALVRKGPQSTTQGDR